MLGKRKLIAVIATISCVGAAMSTGSGTASAGPDAASILRVVEEVVPTLARRLDAGVFEMQPLLVSQASRLTPVRDTAELSKFRDVWSNFTPKRAAAGEIVELGQNAPPAYKRARILLCKSAVDLLADENVSDWQDTMDQVNSQILESSGVQRLAIYNRLNETVQDLVSSCICKAAAKLEVWAAKKAFCR
jgi:hypothetical protein